MGLSAREEALLDYAERLTVSPAEIRRADANALRRAGLTDREILDLTQVAAYFAYVNRIALGLGAQLEGSQERLGHTPAEP